MFLIGCNIGSSGQEQTSVKTLQKLRLSALLRWSFFIVNFRKDSLRFVLWKVLLAHYLLLPYTHVMTIEERKNHLSPLMDKFADEYLVDPSDGGAAYMRANSKCSNKKSASVQASKFLKMEKVQNALKDRAKNKLGVLEARIMQNIEFWLEIRDGTTPGVGEGSLVSLTKVQEILEHLPEKTLKKIFELPTYNVPDGRVVDRMKASENLGKYMQMFVEKKEISLEGQVIIKDDI